MKRLFIWPVLVAILALGGCAAQLKSVGDFVTAASQTFTSPLGPVDIYRVKNVYAAGLQLAADYRSYCWSKPYAALIADPIMKPVCENRRAAVRSMQRTAGISSRSIRAADTFIRENPTGNAVTYVRAAWQAVQDFRASIPAIK